MANFSETRYGIGERMGFDCEIIATVDHYHHLKDEDGKTHRSVYELARVHLSRHFQDHQDWQEFISECLEVFNALSKAYQHHPDGPAQVSMRFVDDGMNQL